MYFTCKEIEQKLLNGETVGDCQLTKPEQLRMLSFLLSSNERSLGNFSDEYIKQLKDAYSSETPIEEQLPSEVVLAEVDQWHLNKVTAYNFGGVNAHDQKAFKFLFDRNGYVFQGDNGHGKTSFASALIWAITGKAINCDKEPDTSSNQSKPVKDLNISPAKLPNWPPLCTYPSNSQKWQKSTPNTKVSLEFINDNEETFLLDRELLPSGETKFYCEKDLDQAGITSLLIETCILMPNKIAHIKLGENQDIVDAIIQLIGLQPLVDLADHVDKLCFRGQNFSRDPKQADIDREYNRISQNIEDAKKALIEISVDETPLNIELVEAKELEEHLLTLQEKYEKEANNYLSQIQEYISSDINFENKEDKRNLKASISVLNSLVQNNNYFADIAYIKSLDELSSSETKILLSDLCFIVYESLDILQQADYIRLKQADDQKLKLKAYAAEYHTETHGESSSVDDCPLCERSFDNNELEKLSKEIKDLKSQADLTKRNFSEICEGLCAKILEKMGDIKGIKPKIPDIGAIKSTLNDGLKAELTSNKDLNYILPDFTTQKAEELSILLENIITDQKETDDPRLAENYPESAQKLVKFCERIFSLSDTQKWWEENRKHYEEALGFVFVESEDQEGKENNSIKETIKLVLEADEKAKPYESVSSFLSQASKDAKRWYELSQDRSERDAIREAIFPLKGLRAFVESQVKQTLEDISDRAAQIFGKIYSPTSLKFSKAIFGKKKTISIKGIVNGTAEIDAALIANTSWLQAVLWSFWIAMRENVIKHIGSNPFPLVILDDPQATFDFHHARSWAREFGEMSRTDVAAPNYAQIILTTYDKVFMNDMEHHADFKGKTACLNRSSDQLTVIDGNEVQIAWSACNETQNPKDSQDFIDLVRNEYEGVLKILLRGQFEDIENDAFGKLAEKLNTLANKDIPPFNSPNIKKFASKVNNAGEPAIKSINLSHHNGKEKLSYADAKIVKDFYEGKGKFKPALNVHRNYLCWIVQDNNPVDVESYEQNSEVVNE